MIVLSDADFDNDVDGQWCRGVVQKHLHDMLIRLRAEIQKRVRDQRLTATQHTAPSNVRGHDLSLVVQKKWLLEIGAVRANNNFVKFRDEQFVVGRVTPQRVDCRQTGAVTLQFVTLTQ